MKNKFLSILFFSVLNFNCTPIATYQCRGGISGTTEWHLIEARGIDSARNAGEFAECRSPLVEQIITEEYAGSTSPSGSKPKSKSWTCETILGRYLDTDAMLRGELSVIRNSQTAKLKSDAERVFLTSALSLEKFAKEHGKTMDDLIPEPRVASALDSDGNEYRKSNASYHRCWQGDNIHPHVTIWPPATWPKPTAATTSGDSYTCDAYAEYVSDLRGSIGSVRKQWTQVRFTIGTLYKSDKGDFQTVAFFSGDPNLDKRYLQDSRSFQDKLTQVQILNLMSAQPKNEVLALASKQEASVSKDIAKTVRPRKSDAICWKNGDPAPDRSSWPIQSNNSKCREWSSVANKFVEADREGVRFQCVKELQAYHLQSSSDGTQELGSMFFPMRNEKNLCGPETHADSGIEAALRRDAEVTGNYQLSGYGGRCWEMGKRKPPVPSSWSGQNGSW